MIELIASRNDGLGERLNSVFNAIVLSHATGIKYAVHWPTSAVFKDKLHSVTPANEIFDGNWIVLHVVQSPPVEAQYARLIKSPEISLKEHLENEVINGRSLISQALLPVELFDSENQRLQAYGAASNEFPFNESIKSLRREINSIKKPKNISAIHVRAGDIIYGQHSEAPGILDKFICAPFIRSIVTLLKTNGKSTIILGQEAEVIKKISSQERLVTRAKLIPEQETNLEKALADIFLMSCCGEIYSGNSGFARFAAQLGQIEMKDPYREIGIDRLSVDAGIECRKNSSMYSLEQLAHTYFSLYFKSKKKSSFSESDFFLSAAIRNCPDNNMFLFYRVVNAYRHGFFEIGDAVARDFLFPLMKLSPKWAHKSRLVIFLRKKSKGVERVTYFKPEAVIFRQAAEYGSSYAKFLLLCISDEFNEQLKCPSVSKMIQEYSPFVEYLKIQEINRKNILIHKDD